MIWQILQVLSTTHGVCDVFDKCVANLGKWLEHREDREAKRYWAERDAKDKEDRRKWLELTSGNRAKSRAERETDTTTCSGEKLGPTARWEQEVQARVVFGPNMGFVMSYKCSPDPDKVREAFAQWRQRSCHLVPGPCPTTCIHYNSCEAARRAHLARLRG